MLVRSRALLKGDIFGRAKGFLRGLLPWFGNPQDLLMKVHAEGARSARNKTDVEAYRDNILICLDLALMGSAPDGSAITDCEPIIHTRGGFFCCLITTAASARYFVKGVSAAGREALFWSAWARGAIRCEGQHYRIVPPAAMSRHGDVVVLLFPALQGLHLDSAERKSAFRQNIQRVVRAIADFNSNHVNSVGRDVLPSTGCDPLPKPRFATIKRTLGGDVTRARHVMRSLSTIEARWPQFRDRLYRKSPCVCHMDFGPNNVALHEEIPVIQDFGMVGLAPAGADLHTVFRYARRLGTGWVDRRNLVENYAGVFEDKRIKIEREAVQTALDAHFSARYRNPNLDSARRPVAFEAAVETGLRLIA